MSLLHEKFIAKDNMMNRLVQKKASEIRFFNDYSKDSLTRFGIVPKKRKNSFGITLKNHKKVVF